MQQRIDVGAHSLPLQVTGEGPTLIWTHGLTSSRRREDLWPLWHLDQITGRRVVRYDARGHGDAGGPADDPRAYEWPTLATDLLALADALDAPTFVSAGVSMGTATTLHAAVRSPERIEAMILTGPPTAWETREAQADAYRAGAEFVRGKDPAALVGRVDPPPVFRDRPVEAQIPDVPGELLPTVLHGAANSNLPPKEALAALDIPTLVLAWADDPGHPVSTAEQLAETIPNAQLHVSPDVDDVRTWTNRMQGFLDSL